MNSLRLSIVLLLFPAVATTQPASRPVRLPVAMVNEIVRRVVAPLEIEGLKPGDVPVAVRWSEVTIDTALGVLWMTGTVVESPDGIPLAGVRLMAGELIPGEDRNRIMTHAGVVADENGRFSITWKLGEKDILFVTMMGHLEAAWPVGELRTLPNRLTKESR